MEDVDLTNGYLL
jgi:hypothetical protein